MAESASEWAARLRRYVAECRTATPIPDRSTLTNEQEWQYSIISDSIRAGMREYSPRYFREQAVVNRRWGYNNPVIVFTSNAPGLLAARDFIGTSYEQVIFLLESEYDASPCGEDSVGEGFYRRFWSTIETEAELENEFVNRFRTQYPIPNGCSYWHHSEGNYSGGLSSNCVTHLWCWDSKTPTRIENSGQVLRS